MTLPCAVLAATLTLSLLTPAGEAPQRQALSEHFVVDRFGGRQEHVDIYVRTAEGGVEYVGSTPGPDRYATRTFASHLDRSVLAVSKDGRSVAFVHEPRFAKRRSGNAAGIYRCEWGKGTKLLYRQDDLRQFSAAWPKPIPENVLVFSLKDGIDPEPTMRALTAEGDVLPLALLEATPLHQAAYEGDLAALGRDVEHREWLNVRAYWGFTPLDVAIQRGHEAAAVRLLEAGAAPSAGEHPALHLAVRYGRLKVVEALLGRGVSVDARDPQGATPLAVGVQGLLIFGSVGGRAVALEARRPVLELLSSTAPTRTPVSRTTRLPSTGRSHR